MGEGHTNSVYALTVFHDHLYSGSHDKKIRKWDPDLVNLDLKIISSQFLTFEYLLYHLNPGPCATPKKQLQPTPSIVSSTSKEEPECERKERNERGALQKEEKEEEEETMIPQENVSKEKKQSPIPLIDSNTLRKRLLKEKQLPVLPVECVYLISEFLTWEDLSKKRTSPIIIKNPSLFFSRSLTDSTDFEYFIEKYYRDEKTQIAIETQQAYQDLKSIACRQI